MRGVMRIYGNTKENSMVLVIRATALLLVLLGIAAIMLSLIMAYDGYKMYKSESKCVAELVKSGIERRDIITGNGTCIYVKNN